METDNLGRNLACVMFPGIVKNNERAIQCLGGIKAISQVYSESSKRLGLSFQPENPFVKKVYAETKKATGVLLRIKVKKAKGDAKREVVSTSVVGTVAKMYKFESMCDFQYLPVHKEGAGPPQCILEEIVPAGTDSLDFISKDCPLFLVPPSFTRSEKPNSYLYTEKRYDTTNTNDDLHNKLRSDRMAPLVRFKFNLTDAFPTETYPFYLNQRDEKFKLMPKLAEEYDIIDKMFQERPVWSSNMLRYKTRIRLSSMKIILPCIAVYMSDGPWRMCWVRLGYDLRKMPESRLYQTLDYRLRRQDGLHALALRSLRLRGRRWWRSLEDSSDDIPAEAVYFEKGMTPVQKQIFYQYCDVHLPEVQELLSEATALCHPVRGWLPTHCGERCRDLISECIRESILTMLQELKPSEGMQEGSSEEASDSEAEDAEFEAEAGASAIEIELEPMEVDNAE